MACKTTLQTTQIQHLWAVAVACLLVEKAVHVQTQSGLFSVWRPSSDCLDLQCQCTLWSTFTTNEFTHTFLWFAHQFTDLPFLHCYSWQCCNKRLTSRSASITVNQLGPGNWSPSLSYMSNGTRLRSSKADPISSAASKRSVVLNTAWQQQEV